MRIEGDIMGRIAVCAGLLAYGASLVIPSGGSYLSLAGGALVGLGVLSLAGIQRRKSGKLCVGVSQNQINVALDEATSRVLGGAGKPWTVTGHSA